MCSTSQMFFCYQCTYIGPLHTLLELTLRNSRISKDLVQPHQSTASLILDHIKEDQRANVGSTCTICEC